MILISRRFGKMSPKFIVPIDSKTEEEDYVRFMFCINCKIKGNVKIDTLKDLIEDGYHYEVAKCICNNCNTSFELKFFPTYSPVNIKKKFRTSNFKNNYEL